MAYEDEIEQKITGSSYEECKEKLFNLYGKDFRITNKIVDFRPGGFLNLRKKPVTVVSYIVNHQKKTIVMNVLKIIQYIIIILKNAQK